METHKLSSDETTILLECVKQECTEQTQTECVKQECTEQIQSEGVKQECTEQTQSECVKQECTEQTQSELKTFEEPVEKTNRIDVDYLTEDTPIPGQEWGVYSFLSPEGIKNCNIRAFKNRGNYGSYEEASEQAERIRNSEPAFNVFVGENFKWTAFDPNPELVKNNNNYYEPKLQELMKGTLENQEKAKQLESQRKRAMIEESIKKELEEKRKKVNKTRDRLKQKVRDRENKKKEQQEKAEEKPEDTTKTFEEKKETVEKLKSETASISENLDKLKKLYADLNKK
jgi:hypothetical protein